jgi:hypothetical protein
VQSNRDLLSRATADGTGDIRLGRRLNARPQWNRGRRVGKRNPQPGPVEAVARGGLTRGTGGPPQVRSAAEVVGVGRAIRKGRRCGEPRQVVAHRANRRDRGEVDRALAALGAGDATCERDQHRRREDQCQRETEDKWQRLAALGPETMPSPGRATVAEEARRETRRAPRRRATGLDAGERPPRAEQSQ